MSGDRLKLDDLVGATVEDAYAEGDTVILAVKRSDGLALHVAVMSDPEGNGPGSLHVFDGESVTFLGCLGGR